MQGALDGLEVFHDFHGQPGTEITRDELCLQIVPINVGLG